MREIEFRAWDIKAREMISTSGIRDNWCFECDETGISLLRDVGDEVCASYSTVESKIMQYTGLKDANGVKIFEGDIMQWHGDESTVAVKWEQATCSYTAFGRLCAMHLKPDEDGDGHLLVIGNIYENPEKLHDQVTTE